MKYLFILASILIGSNVIAQNIIASAELEAQNINEVRVEGSFCDVYVQQGDRNYLNAVIRGKGDKGDYEFDTEISGSTLVVKVLRKERSSWRGYNINESKIELTVLNGVKLDIENSSGDVFVKDVDLEDSEIETTSGDISIKRIKANLEVESSSGDISINDLVGDLEMQSTSGDQRIYTAEGNIDTRSSSGDITLSGFSGDIEISATSGDVELRGGIGTLNIETSSGNIEGSDVELNGDAYLKATSGDIEIDFVNDIDDLSFDLTATSGDLDVGNKAGEKKLYINRGGFRIVGVTSSGDQEYE
jgi:DUF4097 and DUF4098 domain-containing protein YvlB